jgi:hypothetical protein
MIKFKSFIIKNPKGMALILFIIIVIVIINLAFMRVKSNTILRMWNAKVSFPITKGVTVDCSYRSQNDEDKYIEAKMNYLKKGVILEMGGLDGLLYSNSYHFSYCLGWTSILVEGDYENYKRMIHNRPDAISFNAVVCKPGDVVKWSTKSTNNLGATLGVIDHMPEQYKKVWRVNDDEHDYELKYCISLNNLTSLIFHDGCHIHVWVLDVEGAELVVLNNFDWSCTFDLILVEANGYDVAKDNEVSKVITKNTGMTQIVDCPKQTLCFISENYK